MESSSEFFKSDVECSKRVLSTRNFEQIRMKKTPEGIKVSTSDCRDRGVVKVDDGKEPLSLLECLHPLQ